MIPKIDQFLEVRQGLHCFKTLLEVWLLVQIFKLLFGEAQFDEPAATLVFWHRQSMPANCEE
jgi:hypothetical protein